MEKTQARVEIKVGVFGHTSRISVPVEDAGFEFDEEHDSFENVYSLVNEKVSLAQARYSIKTTRPDTKLYMKPSLHAKQAQLVALSADNWVSMLAKARANYSKKKTCNGPFIVHLHMYAAKEVVQGIRRATPARIAEAAEAIDSYLAERADIHVGNIARTHWTISQARQLNDSGVNLPDNANFRQMQHLDAMGARNTEKVRTENVMATLTVQLNGSRDMQLTFSIQDLRAVMELTNYSLIAAGLLSSLQPPRDPSVNMEGINHLSD